MPCDSIILNQVDLPKMHPTLAGAALKNMGATDISTNNEGQIIGFTFEGSRYSLRRGILTGESGQSLRTVGQVADRLKVGYSGQVVRMQAAQNGWTVQQTGPTSYNVIKK